MSRLTNTTSVWSNLEARIKEDLEMVELGDPSMEADLTAEVDDLRKVFDKMSFEALLNGKYDKENALVSIHAGVGGTDAQDWVKMLLRMYLRWAEQHRIKTEILDQTDGEEAGIKSVTISMRGAYTFGYLQSERGVHRLVRLSPFNANKLRQTSFALVEVVPDVQDEIDIVIEDKDIEVDTYRSNGAGGQNVQKNETAIRITHKPSGLVVTCQNERSQAQNRDRAMQVLKARLLDLEQRKKDAEFSQLKGDHIEMGWGNQIRSYVLHPYQMVKDHRTDHETSNTGAVLDGTLDDFMEAYLKSRVGEKRE